MVWVCPAWSPDLFPGWSFSPKWYGLSYLVSFAWAWWILYRHAPLSQTEKETLLFYASSGILLGGRLGYIFLYEPLYYAQDIMRIFWLRDGGMAFHGGFLGCVLGIFLFSKRYQKNFWVFSDLGALIAPVGLFLGRCANFINHELYGKPFSGPWSVIMMRVDSTPRHPSQLYEAFLEGCVLGSILWLLKNRSLAQKPGFLSALFCLGYGIFRFIGEFWRTPDGTFTFGPWTLSFGQLYCLPLMVIGFWLIQKYCSSYRK